MKTLSLALGFFALALYGQGLWISWMHRFHLGEAIKAYGPQGHLKKRGTPSVGGVVALFLLPLAVAALYLTNTAGALDLAKIWSYPVLAALVGLVDDTLKLRRSSSEGLKSLQKLFLQILVTLPWAYYLAREGVHLVPTFQLPFYHGFALLVFLGVGILNAVNVTDGLDGLACGAVSISLMAVVCLFGDEAVRASAIMGLALSLAFLWHNSHPASVFMGDVGSHMWGGLLLSLCVAGDYLLFVVPLGFLFGIEIASSAIQIVAIRKFGKKVFLMSPLHHHFEILGWKETSIVPRFWLIHLAGIVAILIFIHSVGGRGVWNV